MARESDSTALSALRSEWGPLSTVDANRISPGSPLNSEAARPGLGVPAHRAPDQWLAWVNSVCILFLLIGVIGARSAFISIKPLPTLEEASAAIIEPIPPPAQATLDDEHEDQTEQEKPDAPQVVVMTPDAPSINF